MSFILKMFSLGLDTIDAEQTHRKMKMKLRPYVLDVRQPDEYRAGHIAGSKLIPLGELSGHVSKLPKNREIICVCRSGTRSTTAARRLKKAGLQPVNMLGGMLAWQRAGFPVKNGKK